MRVGSSATNRRPYPVLSPAASVFACATWLRQESTGSRPCAAGSSPNGESP